MTRFLIKNVNHTYCLAFLRNLVFQNWDAYSEVGIVYITVEYVWRKLTYEGLRVWVEYKTLGMITVTGMTWL